MKIKCMIVDDEPPARELLVSYLTPLEGFETPVQFGNALEAFTYLQKNNTDLMFLDIQMPRMNGLELIRSLRQVPRVILTTAFREYATDGFDLDVLDYLVKPISFDRFMKAIGKYHHYCLRQLPEEPKGDGFEEAYLFIKVNKDQIKVYFKDIVYIESIKDYLRIHTTEKAYITYLRLNYMQEKLPPNHFLRIHKSYIISINEIRSFRTDTVRVGQTDLPIGRFYKKEFLEAFSGGTG